MTHNNKGLQLCNLWHPPLKLTAGSRRIVALSCKRKPIKVPSCHSQTLEVLTYLLKNTLHVISHRARQSKFPYFLTLGNGTFPACKTASLAAYHFLFKYQYIMMSSKKKKMQKRSLPSGTFRINTVDSNAV